MFGAETNFILALAAVADLESSISVNGNFQLFHTLLALVRGLFRRFLNVRDPARIADDRMQGCGNGGDVFGGDRRLNCRRRVLRRSVLNWET